MYKEMNKKKKRKTIQKTLKNYFTPTDDNRNVSHNVL